MVNMASGIARGRVLSPTTVAVAVAVVVEVSHQNGDLSHASLVNIRSHKGSHQLNGLGYLCQLTAVKTSNPLTSVTWPHHRLRCSLWGCLLDGGVAQGNKQVNLGHLMHAAYIFAIWLFDMGDPFYGQLTPVTTRYPLTSIPWPYRRLKWRTHRDNVFILRLPLTRLWIFIGSQAQVFSQNIKTSQKIEAPLLSLAKSMYYTLKKTHLYLFVRWNFSKHWQWYSKE